MDDSKPVRLLQLFNLALTSRSNLGGRASCTRDWDIAHTYNGLHAEVKRLVNDQSFDRQVPKAWCLEPLYHVTLGALALAVALVALWWAVGDQAVVIASAVVFGVIFVFFVLPWWITGNAWFLASTTQQVADRLDLLLNYLRTHMATKYPGSFHEVEEGFENLAHSKELELERLRTANQELSRDNWELKRRLSAAMASPRSEEVLTQLLTRFHLVVGQLQRRRENRATISIADEYDVQDLLHALLRLYFNDVRSEEWTPSYGGGSSRMDFLLPNEMVVVEAKKTRPGLTDRQLSDELIVDIARYRGHPKCRTLLCFIYDPDECIRNPGGLENDLARLGGNPAVKVIVAPRR